MTIARDTIWACGYYWFDQCESTTGTSFSGYGFIPTDAQYSPPDQNFMTGEVVSGASPSPRPMDICSIFRTVGHIYREHDESNDQLPDRCQWYL